MRGIRPVAWLAALVSLFVGAMAVLAYTGGQAEAGRQAFGAICVGCHGANLEGAVGPALVGPAFQATWRNAAALFQFVSQNMPLSRPGSLSRAESWNILAYLLQRNGVSPDEQPLNERTAEGVRLQQPA